MHPCRLTLILYKSYGCSHANPCKTACRTHAINVNTTWTGTSPQETAHEPVQRQLLESPRAELVAPPATHPTAPDLSPGGTVALDRRATPSFTHRTRPTRLAPCRAVEPYRWAPRPAHLLQPTGPPGSSPPAGTPASHPGAHLRH